jgi:phenylalanyl-tRNA synthetase beta chain
MKISYNWLSQYIDISDSIEEVAEKLTMAGIEVEAIHRLGNIPEGIVIGEILERNPHPDADKLSVCRVNSGAEELQIVCGAPNCDAGKKVPLATIGTVFVDSESGKEFPIKKCKLRGVESFGMLCSGKELGLDDDHSGLMELDTSLETGTPMDKVIKSDVMFELEITSNRPDWLSHWGIARDLVPLTGKELKFPEISLPEPNVQSEFVDGLVEIKDYDLCPRYTGRVIKNVKVKESPAWLKERLVNIGLRPINNIVDITNFVLMELGQPLHAFDLNLLSGKKVIVRRAGNGEKIVTLDGDEHELKDNYLVIADAEKPVALAGVMGGEHSGVTEETVDVLLESAYFKASNIRRTSKELGISSDSSYRFERGVDWKMVETASDRAAALILELAGGELVTGLVDVKQSEPETETLPCRFAKIKGLIGSDISNDEIVDIFKKLELSPSEIDDEKCVITVPSFRLDIQREADLAEEVARIHGLDKIPVIPVASKSVAEFAKDAYFRQEELMDEFIALGLVECVNYTLTDKDSSLKDTRFTESDLVQLENPISIDQGFLRPSLFSGMLQNVSHNIARQNIDLGLFELGRVFCANEKLYPEERYECCIALTGRKNPERFSAELDEVCDFYDLKGMLESLFENRRIKSARFSACEDGRFEKGVCAEINVDGKSIGFIGQVASKFTKGMRIKYPLYMAIIDADPILNRKTGKIYFEAIPQFPSTSRDVAFVADKSLEHQQVLDFIRKSNLKNLEKVELFDIFEDDKTLGEGKKSMAYSLTFRNPERTLTDKEVNTAHEKLRNRLASELNVELR